MIKVLLVDDEIYSLQGMKYIIPWKKLGCEICGTAENYIKALEIAEKKRPNIIITDINMPGKNGLQLIEEIKSNVLPNIQSIIITGYDDFKYAVKAVKLSAVDFILKPIEDEELIEAIKKAIKKIDDKNNIVSKDRKLLDIMRGETPVDNLTSFFKISDNISIVLIETKFKDERIILGVKKVLENFCQNRFQSGYFIVKPHNNRLAIVINKNLKECTDDMKDFQIDVLNLREQTVTITISEFDKSYLIHELYEQSKNLMDEKFYFGSGCIIDKIYNPKQKVLDKEYIELLKKVEVAIECRNKKLAFEKAKEFFRFCKLCKLNREIVEGLTIELIVFCKKCVSDITKDTYMDKEIGSLVQGLTLNELNEKVIVNINDTIDTIREINGQIEEAGIQNAIEYIHNNFEKNISLKMVASEVFLNESYFSRVFKKTMGIGFSEYVTNLRIKRSIEILKTGKTIKEVAKLVGYMDYRIFSTNFKKCTGYTPTQFINK